jgi:Arc/MetJ-type ribon-helix-helix transcriptional regulator
MSTTDEYTTVRLPKELMEEIDNILKRGVMGYKSRAEFIKEAIREKLKTIPREILEQLPLEHFNLSENGVRILDRSLANEHSRGRIIDVYFKPDKVLCEYCQSNNCKHVEFALSLPEVRKILSEKGWEIRRKIKEI